ncbi:MAG: hypothetical protein ACLUGC_05535, partial [Ruminococcus callidus]
ICKQMACKVARRSLCGIALWETHIKKALSCENRTRLTLVQNHPFSKSRHSSVLNANTTSAPTVKAGSAQPLGRELQHMPPDGFSALPALCTGRLSGNIFQKIR